MLKIHHLMQSQSERIIWLCEELGVPYELKIYARDRVTRLAPPEYKALHPLGTAPVINDGTVVLAETTAVVEYILVKYGPGHLVPASTADNFPDYLFWFHFANGSLQPNLGRSMLISRVNVPDDHPTARYVDASRKLVLDLVEKRLATVQFLAGDALTAADIVAVFSLTTMRLFLPFNLSSYPNIRDYLLRIGARPAYRRAMNKGDPDMTPMLD